MDLGGTDWQSFVECLRASFFLEPPAMLGMAAVFTSLIQGKDRGPGADSSQSPNFYPVES